MNIKMIENYLNTNKPIDLYNMFDWNLKNEIAFSEFKHIFASYKSNAYEHSLYLNNVDEGNGELIWLDKYENNGVSLTVKNFKISSIIMLPIIKYPDKNKITLNKYIMPVNSGWEVFWGGDNELFNYHYPNESQRYAYDLIIRKNNISYKNFGYINKDYYCFSEDIIAPQDGIIIDIENKQTDSDSQKDNNLFGNYILISHKNNEYSLLAHLEYSSINVSIGEKVHQGDLIGKCGNSGNSSEPHLHFQVMNSSKIDECVSLKIKFSNGRSPIKGDSI
ncbi:M23 family metallopeptidase [Staphylococcus haemolyticus]|nr:M23 family metallopeptidase [Staphylococcus haemolyticus]